MNHHEVHRLLLMVQSGNTDAFKQLYCGLFKVIASFSFSILNDYSLAEDVAQETFVTVYTKSTQYRYHKNALSWILTIAGNISRDILKKQSRETEIYIKPTDEKSPEFLVDQRDSIERALLKLSPTCRQIVVLHLVGGLKHREIAAMLALPLGTVLRKYRESISELYEAEKGACSHEQA